MIVRRAFPTISIRTGDWRDALRAGANGQNNVWRVWVWSGIDGRAAVAAQELYEWGWRLKWWLGASVPVCGLLGALSWHLGGIWWLSVLAAFELLLVAVETLHPIQRAKELRSHEIEVQAAARLYGYDADAYRRREAEVMPTYAWLKHMRVADIEAAMRSHSKMAADWVDRHLKVLEKIRAA